METFFFFFSEGGIGASHSKDYISLVPGCTNGHGVLAI